MNYQEIEGDLIKFAKESKFDVIAHGCNCFCTMGAGIAPQMAKEFGCDKFALEKPWYKGNINKLGCIDFNKIDLATREIVHSCNPVSESLYVINAYTQYYYGRNHEDGVDIPLDYEALTLCMRKINFRFKGRHIGLPQIGCGLAGGDWDRVKSIIQSELCDCDITIVIYKP